MFHLNEGDKAPDFKALDQSENEIQLKDFIGKKVILYFYPKDNTPTCTVEACNFRDNHQSLVDKGFVVLGVSPDPVKKHVKFADKFELPFSLLADEDHIILNAYGVWGLKKFMGREYDGVHRTTFIIDEKGNIEKIIKKVKSKESTKQVLEALGME